MAEATAGGAEISRTTGRSSALTTRTLARLSVEKLLVVVGPQQRVDRNGDRAGLDGAPERGGEREAVEQQQHHALFGTHRAHVAQRAAEAIDVLEQLP